MERILRGDYVDASALMIKNKRREEKMSGEEFSGVMSKEVSIEKRKERYEKEIAFRKKSILTKKAEMLEHKNALLHYENLFGKINQEEQDELQEKATLN